MRCVNFVNPLFMGLFIFAVILASPLNAPYFIDADIGWHIASGDLIRQLGNARLADNFSFTASGKSWYNMMWLAEVVMSYIYEAGGANALMFAAWMCTAVTLTILAKIIWDLKAGIIPVMFVSVIALLVLCNGAMIRPQALSFVFLALFYLILSNHGRLDSPKRWPLFILPLIMLVWVNWHGGFILGFTVLGAFGLDALSSRNKDLIKRIIAISVLCSLATLCNPYGYKVYYSVYGLMVSEGRHYVEEWRVFKFGIDFSYSIYLLFFYQFCRFYSQKIPVAEKCLAFFWMPMALACLRYTHVAAILVSPFFALSFRETIMQSAALSARFLEEEGRYEKWMQSTRVKVWLTVIAIALTFACAMPKVQAFLRGGETGFNQEFNPQKAARFIMDNYKDVRLFNDYNLAGYALLESKGRLKVFFYAVATGSDSEEILKKYYKTLFAKTRSEYEVLNEYGINTVLLAKDNKGLLAGLLSDSDWGITYEDRYFVIFRRIEH